MLGVRKTAYLRDLLNQLANIVIMNQVPAYLLALAAYLAAKPNALLVFHQRPQ